MQRRVNKRLRGTSASCPGCSRKQTVLSAAAMSASYQSRPDNANQRKAGPSGPPRRSLAKLFAFLDQRVSERIVGSSRSHKVASESSPLERLVGIHFASDLELVGLVERTEGKDLAVWDNLDFPTHCGATLRAEFVMHRLAAFSDAGKCLSFTDEFNLAVASVITDSPYALPVRFLQASQWHIKT